MGHQGQVPPQPQGPHHWVGRAESGSIGSPCHPTWAWWTEEGPGPAALCCSSTLAGTAWPPAPQSARREGRVPRPSGAICLPNLSVGLAGSSSQATRGRSCCSKNWHWLAPTGTGFSAFGFQLVSGNRKLGDVGACLLRNTQKPTFQRESPLSSPDWGQVSPSIWMQVNLTSSTLAHWPRLTFSSLESCGGHMKLL